MTRTFRAAIILPLVTGLLLAAACGSGADKHAAQTTATPAASAYSAASATATPHTAYPLTVSSSDGRSVTLSKAPERIVSLSPSQTETLFAIGAGDAVVGTDRFSDYPEAAKALPKIDYSNPNVEALAALRPDLVIAATRQKLLAPTLEQAGLKVLLLEEPASLGGVIERIRLAGQITDRSVPADELASRMQERITAITQKVSGVVIGPRIYHEIDPKLFAAGPSSFVGDL